MSNKRTITHEEMKDPVIIRAFLKAYNERTIDAGYLSKNKKIKTNCITTRPKRGTDCREFTDMYMSFQISNPYKELTYLRCQAHRVSAFLFLGELNEDLVSLHKCDIKMCCNPTHLYIGTQKDNQNDCNNRRTDQGPNRRLTRHEWESINYWKDRGEHTIEELSQYFKVTRNTIDIGGQNFTTDGSEVIGPVFAPRMIPEADKVTRIKQSIELGIEFIEIRKFCREYEWNFSWELDEECERLGTSRARVYEGMRLTGSNPDPANYKYGKQRLIKMITDGIDISVPI